MKTAIVPVPYNNFAYNAADAKGFERGDMGKGKPKVARIYSVHRIENGIAYCTSRDAFGVIHHERFPVDTLKPYSAKSV